MQTLLIGDIQGCFTELQELIEKAGLAAGDTIIALGDLVDRGPDSPGVLDFFMTQANTRAIMGNHERKHVRSFHGEISPALSQRIAREQFGEARYPVAVAQMAALPTYLELPEAILVHAFFEPGVPLARQRDNIIVGSMRGEAYLMQQCERPWYELYDGDKPIVVGHRDYTGDHTPFVYRDRVFGLDTGCCFGGALTGLLLPSFRCVSVPARKNYWPEVQRQYAHLRTGPPPEYTYTWEEIATFVATMTSRPALAPATQDAVSRLQAVLEEAEHSLTALYVYIQQESQRLLAALQADATFAALPARQQGLQYTARLGPTPLAPCFQRARQGTLQREDVRRAFKKPGEVIALAREMQLLS